MNKPSIRINILMQIVFVCAEVAFLRQVYGVAPLLNWGIVATLFAVMTLYFIIRLALLRTGKMPIALHVNGSIIHSNQAMWLSNAAVIGGLWLLLPYATDLLLLAYINVTVAVTCDFMIRSIKRPMRDEEFTWLAPSMISLSNALYVIVHPMEYSIAIAATNLFICGVFLLAKWQMRTLLYDLYWARNAAEVAQAEAEQSRDARTHFLAAASHDLAQPLQAARMFADAVVRQPAGPKRDKAIANLGWTFDSTQALLDQMMDHLRLDGGDTAIHLGHVAIGPLLAQVGAMHEPHALAIGVSINVLPSTHIAYADARLVERAISNFIANALRHAKARRILVGARRHGPALRIWVIDDGVGVSTRDAARLFDDGFQGSAHHDELRGGEVRGGFGLGLSSARRAGELIGGTVGFDQRWKRGSAFFLELNRVSDISLGGENLPNL